LAELVGVTVMVLTRIAEVIVVLLIPSTQDPGEHLEQAATSSLRILSKLLVTYVHPFIAV
jgi:hypothetical protein